MTAPGATGRGTSPKARAHLARMRAARLERQRQRTERGGDWRDGHWLTGESLQLGRKENGPAPGDMDERSVRALDFSDRSNVDWRDMDAAEEYN